MATELKRRDALKLLSAMAISTAIPSELWALGRAVNAQIAKGVTLRTLNPHQDATVTLIADMIIPATETPGAKAARVNEFIDLILTDWSDTDEKQLFLNGLADLDQQSRNLHGKAFVDCSEKQQVGLLTQMDNQLAADWRAVDRATRRHPEPPKTFFYLMKHLTLVGYYTSDIGAQQELQYEIIPTQHGGCIPVDDSSKA
jgi:Gluconate 2-dehydrogenase subunit 3